MLFYVFFIPQKSQMRELRVLVL